MASQKQPNVSLDLEAHRRLGDLKLAIQSEGLPKETRRQDIVSALLFYTTPPQAAGMTAAFLRYVADRDSGAEVEPDADSLTE